MIEMYVAECSRRYKQYKQTTLTHIDTHTHTHTHANAKLISNKNVFPSADIWTGHWGAKEREGERGRTTERDKWKERGKNRF